MVMMTSWAIIFNYLRSGDPCRNYPNDLLIPCQSLLKRTVEGHIHPYIHQSFPSFCKLRNRPTNNLPLTHIVTRNSYINKSLFQLVTSTACPTPQWPLKSWFAVSIKILSPHGYFYLLVWTLILYRQDCLGTRRRQTSSWWYRRHRGTPDPYIWHERAVTHCSQWVDSPDRKSFLAEFGPGGKYENTVAIYRENDSAAKLGVFDKALIDGLPSTVRWIAHNGAGYDPVDVHACKAKGVCKAALNLQPSRYFVSIPQTPNFCFHLTMWQHSDDLNLSRHLSLEHSGSGWRSHSYNCPLPSPFDHATILGCWALIARLNLEASRP